MDSHLVAVKVGVKGFTSKRVQLERLALYQYRLKGLDSQTVQCRSAVQQYRVLAYNFVKNGEHFGGFLLNIKLGLFKVKGNSLVHQFFHDERLEQFKRHLCRKSALPKLEFRSNNDYRAS